MDTTTYESPWLVARLVAHADEAQKLLMLEITAADLPLGNEEPPAQLALVLDRSGSMSGQKLAITREAAARLIRSLRPIDCVGVVIYDDEVQVLSPPAPPSEYLADVVARIQPGDTTNLYGGWVRGAKMLKPGGHVVLLSDGLANVGRYTDAETLAYHASISYREYKITTTTIGVGDDYDEQLMSGMARAGGGAHYFARSTDDIMRAFSEQRWAVANRALSQLMARVGAEMHLIGDLLAGERQNVVIPIDVLPQEISLYFTVVSSGEEVRLSIPVPSHFGVHHEVTAYHLIWQARDLLDRAGEVSYPALAQELQSPMRELLLQMTNHPLADEPLLTNMRTLLRTSYQQLQQLAASYNPAGAALFRKRSHAKARFFEKPVFGSLSAMDEDFAAAEELAASRLVDERLQHYRVDPQAFQLMSPEEWIQWKMAPVRVEHRYVMVVTPRRSDGFCQGELEQRLGRYVKVLPLPITAQQVEQMIRQATP
ncbi:MAG: VWA domain-containing protein [Armatimonadota bacterium]|nr:VWA domain-containing protein [bacterium]MDW8320623.1 VWA domain-containing protein [Armatimonadota bacterium]